VKWCPPRIRGKRLCAALAILDDHALHVILDQQLFFLEFLFLDLFRIVLEGPLGVLLQFFLAQLMLEKQFLNNSLCSISISFMR